MASTEAAWQKLEVAMCRKVPNAKLSLAKLPMVPEISLALIDQSYPQADLTQAQVEALMDNPPYWAFCWASGQVMARYLIDNPLIVKDRTIVDFGSGSGVVAIAAAMAGARHSVALDIDQDAIEASRLNAELNCANIDCVSQLEDIQIDTSNSLLLIADVFYDADNIPLLQDFIHDYDDVIIADSRVRPSALTGVYEVARYSSCTVPDLAEAIDFNSVGIYRLA